MEFLNKYWPFEHGISVVVTIIALFIALTLALKTRKNKNAIPIKAVYIFMGVLAVILIINLTTLAHEFMRESVAYNTKLPIKRDFYINEKSKSPNIYWIHADGMANNDTLEKYFNDKQPEFSEALAKRGFTINPAANFEAMHSTGIAIPILMNPYSYDNWTRDTISKITDSKLLNWYEFTILRVNSELQYALSAKNYALNIIGPHGFYYPIRGGKFWSTGSDIIIVRDQIFSHDYLQDNFLLNLWGFNNLYARAAANAFIKIFKNYLNFEGENYKAKIDESKLKEIFINGWDASNTELDFAGALYDVLYGNYPTPRLTIIHDVMPHNPFDHDENGVKIKDKNMNPLDYHPQHIWSGKVLINIVDMILEVDPDAVIIIQSDHGLHGNTDEEFKKAFGEKANTRELWNSTMSAIRVPEKFQNGEERYAMQTPLNITRYLVNNFVGKNYEYISPDIAY